MKGWKTWAGGLVLILPGLAEILFGAGILINEVVNGTFSTDAGIGHIKTGSLGVGAGLAAIGVGHKIEKHTEAVKGSRG